MAMIKIKTETGKAFYADRYDFNNIDDAILYLEDILRKIFNETGLSATFDRWWNTVNYVHSNDGYLLSELCLRASQAGYFTIPYSENLIEMLDFRCKNEDINSIIFVDKKSYRAVGPTIKDDLIIILGGLKVK